MISYTVGSKMVGFALCVAATFTIIPLCSGDSVSYGDRPLIISLEDIGTLSSPRSQSEQENVYGRNSKRREIDENGCFLTTAKLVDAVDDYVVGEKNSETYQRFGKIDTWCVSHISDFRSLFSAQRNPLMADFEANLSDWDTSSATVFTSMFRGAVRFRSNLGRWNVARVEHADSMFRDAHRFDSDLSQWNTTSLRKTNLMFKNAKRFDSDVSTWNVSRVSNLCYMFAGAVSFRQNLCAWGDLLPLASTSGAFQGATRCTETTDPDLALVPAGPFCDACERINDETEEAR